MMLSQEILALVPLNKPSPVGYMNVYEEGDVWIKVRGCEDCPPENNCCKKCPLSNDKGCYLHLINNGQDKPFHCVVQPSPLKHRPNCVLEYKCSKGTYIGLIRKQRDPRYVLRYEGTGKKINVS